MCGWFYKIKRRLLDARSFGENSFKSVVNSCNNNFYLTLLLLFYVVILQRHLSNARELVPPHFNHFESIYYKKLLKGKTSWCSCTCWTSFFTIKAGQPDSKTNQQRYCNEVTLNSCWNVMPSLKLLPYGPFTLRNCDVANLETS